MKQAEAGLAVKEVCRQGGFSEPTFYKWRAKYGGMDTSMMSKLKELEEENRKLAQIVTDRGYVEVGTQITPLLSPNDETLTLDSWFEVSYEKRVQNIEEAMVEVGFALSIEKVAARA